MFRTNSPSGTLIADMDQIKSGEDMDRLPD